MSKEEAATNPIGSGAYEFVKWDKGSQIVLKKAKNSAVPANFENLIDSNINLTDDSTVTGKLTLGGGTVATANCLSITSGSADIWHASAHGDLGSTSLYNDWMAKLHQLDARGWSRQHSLHTQRKASQAAHQPCLPQSLAPLSTVYLRPTHHRPSHGEPLWGGAGHVRRKPS